MFELPAHLPPAYAAPPALMERCVSAAASHFNIHPNVIWAIIDVEGGKVGTMSKNSNGTYDMGIMQINTINLESVTRSFPDVTWQDIAYKPCVNIAIGTWFLRQKIDEAGTLWDGVGNYHSKTVKYKMPYLERIYKSYQKRATKLASGH